MNGMSATPAISATLGIPALQLRNVTKKIGKKNLVSDLTFDVMRGEVFGFLGPNGAGKTTTIRMIVGHMKTSSGQVLINGTDIAKDFEKAIRHIGAIVENPEMYKFMTGRQNLLHFGRLTPGVTTARIQETIALVGLEERVDDKVKAYSLGMRQRLGLAQALLHKPSILILDEPTNGLDPAGIRELRDHLRHLAQTENIAVIVSSHLLSEMELMCDRVDVIQAGKLVAVKTLNEMKVQHGNGEITLLFEVDEPVKAKKIIELTLQGVKVVLQENGVELKMLRHQITTLNRALLLAGVEVYGIQTLNKSLEDSFLEMTGGSIR